MAVGGTAWGQQGDRVRDKGGGRRLIGKPWVWEGVGGDGQGGVDEASHVEEKAEVPPYACSAQEAKTTEGLPISADILLSPAPP